MPLQMFVYPVNMEASLPEEFTLYTQTAISPAMLDMEAIDANREKWIQAWTEVMLK
jgi:thiamine transport system substrate-binding protein